jgi:hypothetical protein
MQINQHRRLRHSDFISGRQADELDAAFRYAMAQGRPLSHYLYLVLYFGFPDDPRRVSGTFHRLRRHHLTPWWHHRMQGREPPEFIWALESVNTVAGRNWHANLVIYLPKKLQAEFSAKLPLWLARVTGVFRVSDNAVDVQVVAEHLGGLAGLRNYFLKGVHPALRARYGLRRTASQGRIFGKRVGVSESLGPKARERALLAARLAA